MTYKPPSLTRGTKPYFKNTSWQSINQRTINGSNPSKGHIRYLEKGIRLEMTKEEFYNWVDEQWDKINALYKAGLTPSIDRISSAGNYSISNIQILERIENSKKIRKRPIVGTSGDGSEIKYESFSAAAKDGFNTGRLWCACNRGRKYKGITWRYRDAA